jgi:hypothetical protein
MVINIHRHLVEKIPHPLGYVARPDDFGLQQRLQMGYQSQRPLIIGNHQNIDANIGQSGLCRSIHLFMTLSDVSQPNGIFESFFNSAHGFHSFAENCSLPVRNKLVLI